jgi:hypothetical protein
LYLYSIENQSYQTRNLTNTKDIYSFFVHSHNKAL